MAGLYEMSKEHRETLRKSRMYLLGNLNPSGRLIDILWSLSVLTDALKEEIEIKQTKGDKIRKLLDELPRRGTTAFDRFIAALKEDNQDHVVLELEKELARQRSTTENNDLNPAPQQSGIPQPESPIMSVKVKPVDLSNRDVLRLLNNSKDVYTMKARPRGKALIINNINFIKTASNRPGAQYDSKNLETLYTELGFKVVSKMDLTAEGIKNACSETSRDVDHKKADCFVVFILSHGTEGYVKGVDDRKVSIQDIITIFEGKNYPLLVNKPKIIFIQACQGVLKTEGVAHDGDMTSLKKEMDELRVQDDSHYRAHEKSDIVIAYSTVPGYKAWRRTDLGSWFVRAIVEVFSAEAYREDLLSLLTKVRQRIADDRIYYNDSALIQLTRTDDTTRKKIYFFPGYYNQ